LTPFDVGLTATIEMCFMNPGICLVQTEQGHIGSGNTAISCAEEPALCGVVTEDLVLLLGPNPPSAESLTLTSQPGPVSTPEPSSLLLLAISVVAIWGLVRRRTAGG
jgi:hypothetical protein